MASWCDWDNTANSGWDYKTDPVTSGHCNATNIWGYGVKTPPTYDRTSAVFVCFQELARDWRTPSTGTSWERNINKIPVNWWVTYSSPLIFISKGNTQVALSAVGNPYDSMFRATKNNSTTSAYTLGTYISLSDGDVLGFRGDTTHLGKDNSNYYQFITSGDGTLTLSGSLDSLVNYNSILDDYTFRRLFASCKNITDASKLVIPSTSISEGCYKATFYDCTALTAIPELPCLSTAPSCYYGMFQDCYNLSSIVSTWTTYWQTGDEEDPDWIQQNHTSVSPVLRTLPATTLANTCYGYMFQGCSALTIPPSLPATTLADNCYRSMFYNCTNLSTAPTLPATTLTPSCYMYMFRSCSKLSSAPYLPAETLKNNSYSWMFANCTSLNSVSAEFSSWGTSGTQYTNGWLTNVSPTGEFHKYRTLSTVVGVSNIPSGWTVGLLPFTVRAYGNVGVSYNSTKPYMYYKLNGGNWTQYPGNTTVNLKSGDSLKIRGDYGKSLKFTMTNSGNVWLKGDIFSMNYSDNYGLEQAYYKTFAGCTNIINAFYLDFSRKDLRTAYEQAGGGYLYVNNPYVFGGMFSGCTNLVRAPYSLPATGLATGCYGGMFKGCTSLTSAPLLPATTLTASCYENMFNGCTSLSTGPYLPATTLTNYCYIHMFRNCTSLNKLSTNFRSWASGVGATSGWVMGVPTGNVGTFYKYSSLTTTRGDNYIPSGWTVTTKS